MNHKQRQTLQALFAHPVSANIDPKQVHNLISALGGAVSHGGHGQVVVHLNGHTHGFATGHHALSKSDVAAVRKFLETAGVTPEDALAPQEGAGP